MPFDLATAKPASGGFDLASAKPAAPDTPPLETPESPLGKVFKMGMAGPAGMMGLSPTDTAGAALEPLLSLGTGAVAGPLSGLAGIAGAALPGPPGQGAQWAGKVGGMTYQPRTEGGKNAMSAIAYPFEKIAQGADWAGGKTTDLTGSPTAGAGVNTLLQFLPQLLGAKGASMLKKPPAPTLEPNVQALLDRGVTLTPGAIKGGAVKRIEEGLQSLPIAGDVVKDARNSSVRQFNTAAINDSLAPIGKKLPKGLEGEEAIAWAREELGKRMDDLTLKMRGDLDAKPPANALPAPGQVGQPPKPTLRNELDNIKQMASHGNLPPDVLGQLNRIIDRDVIGKFQNGKADGATLQGIGTNLRGHVERMGRSDNADVQALGQAVKEINAAVDRMIADVNPNLAPEWSAAKDGYARFKVSQKAAGSKGAKEGVFNPSQYDSAVRAQDKTKDKRAYSEGTARQQDLSNAAVDRLAPTLADSGTPFRVALMHAMTDPKALAALAGAGIPTSMLYSPLGIQMMQRMLTKPPAVGRMGAIAAAPGAAQFAQLQPPPDQ